MRSVAQTDTRCAHLPTPSGFSRCHPQRAESGGKRSTGLPYKAVRHGRHPFGPGRMPAPSGNPVVATTAGDSVHQHRPGGLASWTATRLAGPAPHQVVPQAPPRPKASLRGCPVLHRPGRVRTASPRRLPMSPADCRFAASSDLAQVRVGDAGQGLVTSRLLISRHSQNSRP